MSGGEGKSRPRCLAHTVNQGPKSPREQGGGPRRPLRVPVHKWAEMTRSPPEGHLDTRPDTCGEDPQKHVLLWSPL